MSSVRQLLAVASMGLAALLTSCNCDPAGGSGAYTCVRTRDSLSSCYSCPTQSGASICNTDGPTAGGCDPTPITCP